MEIYSLFGMLLEALQRYGARDAGLHIRLSDIVDHLGILFRAPQRQVGSQADAARFLVEHLFEMYAQFKRMAPAYFALRAIDDYFEVSMQYYGFHILKAQRALEIVRSDRAAPRFNSASLADILSTDYYFNLLKCRDLWNEVSTLIRKQALGYMHLDPPTHSLG